MRLVIWSLCGEAHYYSSCEFLQGIWCFCSFAFAVLLWQFCFVIDGESWLMNIVNHMNLIIWVHLGAIWVHLGALGCNLLVCNLHLCNLHLCNLHLEQKWLCALGQKWRWRLRVNPSLAWDIPYKNGVQSACVHLLMCNLHLEKKWLCALGQIVF